MQCPRCGSDSVRGTWNSRIRRDDRDVWIKAECWICSGCRLRFITPQQEDENESLAAAVWRDTYSEAMPPPPAGVRIRKLMRTPEGRARVARVFGRVLEQKVKEKQP